jgi:hypothetical protein
MVKTWPVFWLLGTQIGGGGCVFGCGALFSEAAAADFSGTFFKLLGLLRP